MTLQEINQLPRERFVQALGWIFEHSPWVAERARPSRPFSSLLALHEAMVRQVEAASSEEQTALLRAHPDLGSRARMSDASTGEQNGAGLHALTPAEFETLRDYRARFGFPFLYAVKGSTKQEIIEALTQRLHRSPEQEFREALHQVFRIARFRLEDFIE